MSEGIKNRILIVGGGRISLSHLPHIIANKSISVVGIVEPNFFLRLLLGRITNLKTFKSLSNINMIEFDSAIILTPPSTHVEISELMIKHKKNIFIEKPISLNFEDSKKILSFAEKNKVVFGTGYIYRHNPIFKKLKNIINSEEYGIIKSAKLSMKGNVNKIGVKKSWRQSLNSGGCIYDYGCHLIELSIYMFGEPNDVNCYSKECLFTKNIVDRFSAEFKYPNSGLICDISCDWADPSQRKASIIIDLETETHKIWTDGQSIKISGLRNEVINIRDLCTNVNFYLRGEDFANNINAFIEALLEKKPDYSIATQAVNCDKIIGLINSQLA